MNKPEALELLNLPLNSTAETVAARYRQLGAFFAADGEFYPELPDLIVQAQARLKEACLAILPDLKNAQQTTTEQVDIMERTKTEHWQQGAEVHIESATGKKKLDDTTPVMETFNNASDLTIKGQYMSLTLRRLLMNVPLKSNYGEEIERFTLIELLFHNIWDYPLNAFSTAKLIDTDGFQHGEECKAYSFEKAVQDGKIVPVSFPAPESPLEDHCKSLGWLWFDEMQKGVLPQRLIVAINLFEPGHTSGWVKNTETLEFFIKGCSTSAVKLSQK